MPVTKGTISHRVLSQRLRNALVGLELPRTSSHADVVAFRLRLQNIKVLIDRGASLPEGVDVKSIIDQVLTKKQSIGGSTFFDVYGQEFRRVVLPLHDLEVNFDKDCSQPGGKRKAHNNHSVSEINSGKSKRPALRSGNVSVVADLLPNIPNRDIRAGRVLTSTLRRDGERSPVQVFANNVIRTLYDLARRSGELDAQGQMWLSLPFPDSSPKISMRYIGFDEKGDVRVTKKSGQEDINPSHLAKIVEHVANLWFFYESLPRDRAVKSYNCTLEKKLDTESICFTQTIDGVTGSRKFSTLQPKALQSLSDNISSSKGVHVSKCLSVNPDLLASGL